MPYTRVLEKAELAGVASLRRTQRCCGCCRPSRAGLSPPGVHGLCGQRARSGLAFPPGRAEQHSFSKREFTKHRLGKQYLFHAV